VSGSPLAHTCSTPYHGHHGHLPRLPPLTMATPSQVNASPSLARDTPLDVEVKLLHNPFACYHPFSVPPPLSVLPPLSVPHTRLPRPTHVPGQGPAGR